MEAEESGGEESLQGEAGLADVEEDRVASRHGDNPIYRATPEAPELPKALGLQPPSFFREARRDPQHDDRASQDWDVVKARQVMTASPSPSPSPGPRIPQKPGKLMSRFPWTQHRGF